LIRSGDGEGHGQGRAWERDADHLSPAAGGPRGDLPGEGRAPREPERFLKALLEATAGYEGDAKLLTAFPTECRGGPDCRISRIIEGPISFFALCEHHSVPFFGHAHIGYIAHEEIIGISKLTRPVRLFARRFTVQERIGVEVADTLVRWLQPHGVAVHLEAVHLGTQMRGVREGALPDLDGLLARQLRVEPGDAHRVPGRGPAVDVPGCRVGSVASQAASPDSP
jgi:GTP cyclohydrolase I